MAIPPRLKRILTQSLFIVLLAALPSFVYWGSLWKRFGFRDDYSSLREAHEEPGKLFGFCGGQGRPLFGMLLDDSFQQIDGIDGLSWARLMVVLSVGVVSAGTTLLLIKRQKWPQIPAVACGLTLGLLPTVQVLVNWGSCWPQAFAGALAIIAFAFTDWGFSVRSSAARVSLVSLGTAVLLASLLTYQPNALMYVVPMAAGWLAARDGKSIRERIHWLAAHAFIVCFALIVAFGLVKALFAFGIVPPSKRVVLEGDVVGKIVWFFKEPCDNVLGFFLLEDKRGHSGPWHDLAAAGVALILLLGAVVEWKRRGWREGLTWALGAIVLGTLAYAVSLVAAERWPTYRTLYALTGVVVVFLIRSLWMFAEGSPRLGRYLSTASIFALVGVCVVSAARSSDAFFTEPQTEELRVMELQADKIDLTKSPKVFVILPSQNDTLGELRYLDEFGSLSADCEWCTKEMLLLLFKERYGDDEEIIRNARFSFGTAEPKKGQYDAVIDMRVRPEGK